MLPEHSRRLLTAYVDGELSGRQRRQAVRLLRRSGEARRLRRRLQGDSRELAALPPVRPAVDLAEGVVQAIQTRHLRPARTPPPATRPFPAGPGFAAAAALLLAVGLGAYLLDPGPDAPNDSGAVAHNPTTPTTPEPGPRPPRPSGLAHEGKLQHEEPGDSHLIDLVDPPKRPAELVKVPPSVERPPEIKKPDLPPRPGTVLGAGQKEPDGLHLAQVEVVLPTLLRLQELDQAPARKQLLETLGKASAFRVELPCRNGTHGFARVRSALASLGFTLKVEPVAAARLKKPRWHTDYAVFAKDLLPEELAALLARIGTEERAGAARRPPDVRLGGNVALAPLYGRDRRELSSLVGVDPILGRPTGAPAGKPRRSALVLRYGVARPSLGSAEVKRFLDARKPARPGTLQVVLVLRGLPG